MQITSLKKRLGDILVDVGIITTDQLKEALEIQKHTGGKLGSILSQMGAINEEVMLAFLGKQCGVSYVSLAEYGEIPANIVRSLPESLVRHQSLIPIAKENNILTVAMSDPFNVFAIDDIKLMTGFDVQIVIASEVDIKTTINKFYSNSAGSWADASILSPIQPSSSKTIFTGREGDLITSIIAKAIEDKASDIHMEPQASEIRVRYCIDGILYERASIQKDIYSKVTQLLEKASGMEPVRSKPRNGRIATQIEKTNAEFSISIIPTVYGDRIVLGRIPEVVSVPSLDKLGFAPEALAVYRKNIEYPNGLVLITGPMGSGKTTTINSSLSTLNFPDRNIIAIEENPSYTIPGINHMKIDTANGFDFAAAIEAAGKQNPDVVMIEELIDQKTANNAIQTAMTGHFVLSTLTASDTSEAIIHLGNMGVEPFLTSSILSMVVAQRLMRIICPQCKEQYSVPKDSLKNLGIKNTFEKDKVTLYRGRGCPKCSMTGYQGRAAIFEIFELNEEISSLILSRAPTAVLRDAFVALGGITLRDAAWYKVVTGVSTIEEMLRVTVKSTFH